MWTNQLSGIYFSVHEDGAPDDSWSEPETVLTGQRNDDALSVVPYPLDRRWNRRGGRGRHLPRPVARSGHAAGHREPTEHGTRRSSVSSRSPRATDRPRRSRERDHRRGCDIARQRRGDLLQALAARSDPLRHRRGVPLIASPTDITIDDVTSSKGPLSREAGLLVLASDRTSGRYLRRRRPRRRSAGRRPGRPGRPTSPQAAPDGATATLLRDTFEPWPKGPAARPAGTSDRRTRRSAVDRRRRRHRPGPERAVVEDRRPRVPRRRRGRRDDAHGPMRVGLSRLALDDATILSVRGSGGETASLRVTDQGVLVRSPARRSARRRASGPPSGIA